MQPTTKKVCIIGAGPRGLVTARHLSTIPNLEITVFEAKDDLGGLWLYKEINSEEKIKERKEVDNYYRLYNCFQDSMYDTLITNLPYFFMEFKDLGMRDVDKDIPLFVRMTTYKQYLDAYAEKFDLRKFIQFKTLIKSVRLYQNFTEEEKTNVRFPKKFVVKTVDAQGDSLNANEKYHSFDYVIVTSGQYSFPYIPNIPGAENFQGKAIHYKNFGSPSAEHFRGKRILIIGGSDSANDMLIQFFSNDIQRAEDCKKVILCSRSVSHIRRSQDFSSFLREGRLSLHEGSAVKFTGTNTVCFSDGTEEEVDTVVYATGYKLKFPYFDCEKDNFIDHDENENRGVFFGPLYKKFISIREPNLLFIGYLETTLVVNILPELQAITAKYIIEGKLEVPSKEGMYEDYNEEVQNHMTHIGSLALFYKTDLSLRFPGLPNNYEHEEWLFFSRWLKRVYPDNDEEKAEKYFNMIAETKKALMKFKAEGNFLQYKKYDYHQIYPKAYRNTTAFV